MKKNIPGWAWSMANQLLGIAPRPESKADAEKVLERALSSEEWARIQEAMDEYIRTCDEELIRLYPDDYRPRLPDPDDY